MFYAVEITGKMQEKVLIMRAKGNPANAIARKVDLSVSSVHRIARATAYHEAGHAAAGALLDQKPDWATIVPDPNTHILAEVTRMDGDLKTEEGLRHEIINYYAGQCAELQAGSSIRRAKLGAIMDDQMARDCVLRILGDDASPKQVASFEGKMRLEAAAFVKRHWPLVKRIAAELLACTTLVWEELDGLRAIYEGEGTEEDLARLREGLASVKESCKLIGKEAKYKGSSKEFGPYVISTWACE